MSTSTREIILIGISCQLLTKVCAITFEGPSLPTNSVRRLTDHAKHYLNSVDWEIKTSNQAETNNKKN